MVKLAANAVPVERISVTADPSIPCAMIHMVRYHWAMQEMLSMKKVTTVLDIACGTGYGTEYLAGYPAARVLGVDCNSISVAEAYKQHGPERLEDPTSTLLYETADGLDFLDRTDDKAFDVVVSFETLEHVDDLDLFLMELLRVTKQKLLISVPNNEPDGSWLYHKTFGITRGRIINALPVENMLIKSFGQFPQPDCSIVPHTHKDRDEFANLIFSITRR